MSEQPSLLEKAVKELNEKDAEGAVAKIKTLVKLVQTNDGEISKLQDSNKELLKEVQKLTAAGGLSPARFAPSL
jgi:phage shock protein A